jgi:GMP synthase (glutamine-hydrolysing)
MYKYFLINFRGLFQTQTVLLTHGDSIDKVAKDFKVSGVSQSDLITSIYHEQFRVYGVQFHPEVDLTPNGKQMLSNFLFEISKLSPNFTMAGRKEECIKYIRDKVGNNKVLVSNFFY